MDFNSDPNRSPATPLDPSSLMTPPTPPPPQTYSYQPTPPSDLTADDRKFSYPEVRPSPATVPLPTGRWVFRPTPPSEADNSLAASPCPPLPFWENRESPPVRLPPRGDEPRTHCVLGVRSLSPTTPPARAQPLVPMVPPPSPLIPPQLPRAPPSAVDYAPTAASRRKTEGPVRPPPSFSLSPLSLSPLGF